MAMISDQELKFLADIMAEKKITRLKTDWLEIEMSPLGFNIPTIEQGKIPITDGMPADDAMLLWSSPLGEEEKEETETKE
jgi:hypothetical protein